MRDSEVLNRELICRVQKGDEVAFELIFRLYHKPLHNFALTYVKRCDLADEIVQETFIKIWEKRSSLDPDQSFKSYLYRCVHNNSINYIKKLNVSFRLSQAYLDEIKYRAQLLESEISDFYFEKLFDEELDFLIRKAIDDLPAQCREIFIMSRFSEMTYAEIADKLMISVNTVKTQLSRALHKIRNSIKIGQQLKVEKF